MLGLIAEARASGARLGPCCDVAGLDVRTVQRWLKRGPDGGLDMRRGPNKTPSNKLSEAERRKVLDVVNSPEFADLSPQQIVPKLADMGMYVASESTIYRVLRQEKLDAHRGRAKPPTRRRPEEYAATGPNQVWSWDISYLRGPVRGEFFYLYLFVDVWSRMIVGWAVHDTESTDLAAELFADICDKHRIDSGQLVLHSDNGGPMKGATMLATLQSLGVIPSFSRPRVSNDNPFAEALFRTVKYRPQYPTSGFETLVHAREWVESFVDWYNNEHQHSGIRFVTPAVRHDGREVALLAHRARVYAQARARHPERWTSQTRNWSPIETVILNPSKRSKLTPSPQPAQAA